MRLLFIAALTLFSSAIYAGGSRAPGANYYHSNSSGSCNGCGYLKKSKRYDRNQYYRGSRGPFFGDQAPGHYYDRRRGIDYHSNAGGYYDRRGRYYRN